MIHTLKTLAFVTAVSMSAFTVAQAQQPTVFASGLLNPSKIILGPTGTLLSAEMGATPNTGRVSVISSSGARRTLIDALPSGLAAPNGDPDGANGLALNGNTLYVAIGEGDTFVNGTQPGTAVVNPVGFSSPIFSTVLQFNLSKSPDQIQAGFTLGAADQSTLADGNTVTLSNSAGDTATVILLSAFRYRPDPNAIYRNSHPYGLEIISADPGHLYMVDAGLNSLVQIDTQTGKAHTLAHFANVPNLGSSGPPVAEAVPDSVRAYGNQLLVTFLSGFPFTPGDSKVVLVDPATRNVAPFINFQSSIIDIVYRTRSIPQSQFFEVEYSANLSTGQPGRVLQFDSPAGTVLADGLNGPSSLALDTSAGTLYIASKTDGTILKINVGQ